MNMNHDYELMGESLVNLIICYQQLANRINQSIEPMQMNMTQISILNHFSWQPAHSTTIGKLAQVMEMNQPAVTKAVKVMVSRGWMRKKQDENDARVFLVSITKGGLKQLDLAREASTPLLVSTLGELSKNDLGQLNKLLIKLKKTLR